MKHRRGTSAKEAKQVLRLLVLSDSHGDAGSVYRAVAAQPEAAAVLYLGDGAADLTAAAAAFPRLAFYPVRGNGDFAPDAAGLPYAREECFGGKPVFSHPWTPLRGQDRPAPGGIRSQGTGRGCSPLRTHAPAPDRLRRRPAYPQSRIPAGRRDLRGGGSTDAGVVLNIVRCRP